MVIPPRFSFAARFLGGRCLVITENSIGYIDTNRDFVWDGPYVETDLGFDLLY